MSEERHGRLQAEQPELHFWRAFRCSLINPPGFFLFYRRHPRIGERSTRDGLQDSNCILVAGVRQLGATFQQTCHCWSHGGDPVTLSKDPHTWNAGPWDQPRDKGLAVLCEALLHRGKEAELLNSTLYLNLIL